MHTCAGRKHYWMILGGLVVALLLCISGAGAASGTAPASDSPAVYLNFNEGSGTLALDASGHGKDRKSVV